MKRTTALLALIFLMAVAQRAKAQNISDIYGVISNILNVDPNAGTTTMRSLLIPMGGLDEGMGTAYSAVCQDSSYFEANPAASSQLSSTELSVFHNNWIADTKIEGAVYTIRTGNLGFGIGGKWLYLPFPATDQFGDRVGAGYYSESMAGFNVSYDFFPGFYFSGLSAGVTAKVAYRSMPAVDSGVTSGNGNSAAGFMIDGGLLSRFNLFKFYSSRNKNFSLALTVKNLGPPVYGDPLPTDATFGLAYSPLKPLLFSIDVTQPIDLVNVSESEAISYAGGALVNITDFFQLHTGLLIESGNPRFSIGTTFDLELVRVTVNYTLDLTTQFTPLNRISIQAAFTLGDLGRADIAKKVDTLYLNGLDAYSRGEVDAAISLWQEALRLDPTFDPARESLDAARASNGLKQTMTELQKIRPSQ
jgi:opacity protein-like surface antigen